MRTQKQIKDIITKYEKELKELEFLPFFRNTPPGIENEQDRIKYLKHIIWALEWVLLPSSSKKEI